MKTELTGSEIESINIICKRHNVPLQQVLNVFKSGEKAKKANDDSIEQLINRSAGDKLQRGWCIEKSYRNDFEGYFANSATIIGINKETIIISCRMSPYSDMERTETLHFSRFRQSTKDQVEKYNRAIDKKKALDRIALNIFTKFKMWWGEDFDNSTLDDLKKYGGPTNYHRFMVDIFDEWVLFLKAADITEMADKEAMFKAMKDYHPLVHEKLHESFIDTLTNLTTVYRSKDIELN